VVEPGPDRDTPFVLLRFDGGRRSQTKAVPERLTPAGLHHAILQAAMASSVDASPVRT
jgi:hypothetical protein